MIKNEKYIKILKNMVACVSHGDYGSVKELSSLELEKMKKREEEAKKQIKINKNLKNNKKIPLENWKNEELRELMECYSKFMLQQIEQTDNLKQLKKEAISIQEFINNM